MHRGNQAKILSPQPVSRGRGEQDRLGAIEGGEGAAICHRHHADTITVDTPLQSAQPHPVLQIYTDHG